MWNLLWVLFCANWLKQVNKLLIVLIVPYYISMEGFLWIFLQQRRVLSFAIFLNWNGTNQWFYKILKHLDDLILASLFPGRCMWRAQCRRRALVWPSQCCLSGSFVWHLSPVWTVWLNTATTGRTSSLALSSALPSPLSWWDSQPQRSYVCVEQRYWGILSVW